MIKVSRLQSVAGVTNAWLTRCFHPLQIVVHCLRAHRCWKKGHFLERYLNITMHSSELASILVGDHLGQVKKVIIPSGETAIIPNCAAPDKLNPVVSIEPIHQQHKHIIAKKNGELYIYDSVFNTTEQCQSANDSLIKALPFAEEEVLLIYDKQICFESSGDVLKHKRGHIKNAKSHRDRLAIVGEDIPLSIFDLHKKVKIFEAAPPDKNWLGIQPETYVAGLDFVGSEGHHVATCSKSDSVIRLYDIRQAIKSNRPAISISLDQEAFNEHADAGRFVAIDSTKDSNHSIVVGSNVGQMIAIDLRLGVVKPDINKPSKKRKRALKPRGYKILGGFKGARGATIKDVKLVRSPSGDYKVISCCLDRYLRLHNFSRTDRSLDKHIYLKTKPLVCCPILYENISAPVEKE